MAENKGQWQPGQSGNPAGRPKWSGETGKYRKQLAEHIPGIIQTMVAQAMQGDVAAARLLVERVLPPMKAADDLIAIALPEGSLTDQGRAVVSAAASGEITTSQAAQLLSGLGDLAKLTQTDELVARIEALEGRNGNAGHAPGKA